MGIVVNKSTRIMTSEEVSKAMIGSAPALREAWIGSVSSLRIGPICHGGRICGQLDRISFEEFEFGATIPADHDFTCKNICSNFDLSFTNRTFAHGIPLILVCNGAILGVN